MYFKPITSHKVPRDRSRVDRMGKAILNNELLSFYDPVIDQSVTVRLADDYCDRYDANLLLNRMYSWRGYGSHHEIAESPSHTTFTASSNERLLGTITLAVDSANGLAADELFKDAIDEFRAYPGAKVCELTKFAFETTKPSKPMLASLFHLIFIYGQHAYGCTDVFIEVNPRHVRFYEHMLGFKRIGDLKDNTSVAAPAQLMWLSVAHIRSQIDEHAGQGVDALTRSLYAYFFSPREEEGLYTRMVTAPATQGCVRVEKVGSPRNVASDAQQYRHTAIQQPPCGCKLHDDICIGAAEMALKQANVENFAPTGRQQ